MAGVSEGQMATWRLHRRRGESHPYYNAIAAASLVAQYSGTDPALNIDPILPAGTVINLNGVLYVTRNALKSKQLGEMDPIGSWRPTYIVPKATGITFADRASVYWDETACNATSVTTNKFIGYAVSNKDIGSATNGTSGTLTTGTATNAAYEVTGGTSADGLVGGYASGDTFVEVEIMSASTINVGGSSGPWVAKAAAGANLATATALGAGAFLVSAGNNATGVGLVAGQECRVKNNAAGGLFVYPPVGGTINALSANSYINMATVTAAVFTPSNANSLIFHTTPVVPS